MIFTQSEKPASGFSIIEMLVVISIIAIIGALLMPGIRRAIMDSTKTSCMNNLKQISVALNSYLPQNNFHLPHCTMRPSNPPIGEEGLPSIRGTIITYAQDPQIFLCPDDPSEKWFKQEGLSYEWASVVNGRNVSAKIANVKVVKFIIMYDYDNFHGDSDDEGAKNFLFVDGHVAPTPAKAAE